jgi:hypothetical protein
MLAVTMPRMPYVRQGSRSPTHTVLEITTTSASLNQPRLAWDGAGGRAGGLAGGQAGSGGQP